MRSCYTNLFCIKKVLKKIKANCGNKTQFVYLRLKFLRLDWTEHNASF